MKVKIFLLVAMVISLSSSMAFGQQGAIVTKTPMKGICPKFLATDECLKCHVAPSGKLKETAPDDHLIYPYGVKIIDYSLPSAKGYFQLNEISNGTSDRVQEFFQYLKKHSVKYAIIELFSPGGSLFAGWRIKSLIDEWKATGNICETRCYSVAASAGALVFVAGSEGYRKANVRSEFMFHELINIKMIDVSTPSDKEEEARILRHLQDTIASWLAMKMKVDKRELDTKLRKKEWWLSGFEAKQIGIVDILVGD